MSITSKTNNVTTTTFVWCNKIPIFTCTFSTLCLILPSTAVNNNYCCSFLYIKYEFFLLHFHFCLDLKSIVFLFSRAGYFSMLKYNDKDECPCHVFHYTEGEINVFIITGNAVCPWQCVIHSGAFWVWQSVLISWRITTCPSLHSLHPQLCIYLTFHSTEQICLGCLNWLSVVFKVLYHRLPSQSNPSRSIPVIMDVLHSCLRRQQRVQSKQKSHGGYVV